MHRFGKLYLMMIVAAISMVVTASRLDAASESISCANSDLQSAIDAAPAHSTLRVSGICAGNFTIAKSIRLVGKPNATLQATTGTVLTVDEGADVRLADITVMGGIGEQDAPVDEGVGGIRNAGTLIFLGRTSVTGNAGFLCEQCPFHEGVGGVINLGLFVMRDQSSVADNTGRIGGISNRGVLYVGERASIRTNEGSSIGGLANGSFAGGAEAPGLAFIGGQASISGNSMRGISNAPDSTLIIGGRAAVFENQAPGRVGFGAGLENLGTVVINDRASVHHNFAGQNGGGIANASQGVVTVVDRAAVYGNVAEGLGGGVFNSGILQLGGRFSIHENTAQDSGGGIYNRGTVTGPIVNVTDNSPDDCFDC